MTVTLTPQPQLRRLRSLPFWQKRFLRRVQAGEKEAKPRTSRTIYLLGSGGNGTIYDNDKIKKYCIYVSKAKSQNYLSARLSYHRIHHLLATIEPLQSTG